MKPEYGIIMERKIDDFTVVEVDTGKASYQGIPWIKLGDFGKRKLENLLVLSRPKDRIRVTYVQNT